MTIKKELDISTGLYTTEELTREEINELESRLESQLPKEIREKRDNLLTNSDWTQVADAPVDQAAWATYRQALRDIPSQAGFPNEITWPTEPEV